MILIGKQLSLLLMLRPQYRFYGEPVVKAAVENGCHHLDISGEPEVRNKII